MPEHSVAWVARAEDRFLQNHKREEVAEMPRQRLASPCSIGTSEISTIAWLVLPAHQTLIR